MKAAATEELREAGQRKMAGFAERAAAAERQTREAAVRIRSLESGQAALQVLLSFTRYREMNDRVIVVLPKFVVIVAVAVVFGDGGDGGGGSGRRGGPWRDYVE